MKNKDFKLLLENWRNLLNENSSGFDDDDDDDDLDPDSDLHYFDDEADLNYDDDLFTDESMSPPTDDEINLFCKRIGIDPKDFKAWAEGLAFDHGLDRNGRPIKNKIEH